MSTIAKKFVYGIFNDDDVALDAVTSLRAKGLKVKDLISPFPIHGMDEALGLERTRLSICCFIYGLFLRSRSGRFVSYCYPRFVEAQRF